MPFSFAPRVGLPFVGINLAVYRCHISMCSFVTAPYYGVRLLPIFPFGSNVKVRSRVYKQYEIVCYKHTLVDRE